MSEPNYVQAIMLDLAEQLDDCDEIRLGLYALLVLTLGPQASLEDVHDAWAVWRNATEPSHRSLILFEHLDPAVQELDRKYLEAIHNTAVGPDGPYTGQECSCAVQHTHA